MMSCASLLLVACLWLCLTHGFHNVARISHSSKTRIVDFNPSTRSSELLSNTQLFASPLSFNPFSSRNRNTRVSWFDGDLQGFYSFVEEQPLLTQDQELNYGKALQMWIKTEELRRKMEKRKEKHLRLLRDEEESENGYVNDGIDGFNYNEMDTSRMTEDGDVVENNVLNNNNNNNNKKEDFVKTIIGAPELVEADFDKNKVTVSDIELANALDCTIEKLDKMYRYHKVAKEKLVNSNLKLVLAVVSRYRSSNIPNVELIAEGVRGLSRAAMRYDYTKGFRFATYATWYVHQAVYEYVRWKKHPAKMPSRYLLLQRRVKEYQRVFLEENKRVANLNEISVALEHSKFDVAKVLEMGNYPLLLYQPIGSAKINSGTRERNAEEYLTAKDSQPADKTGMQDLRDEMEKMLSSNLNDVERNVLRLRLGLDSGRPKAVKEIGRKFKISWKDVRNYEKEAIAKLKESAEISGFIESYDELSV